MFAVDTSPIVVRNAGSDTQSTLTFSGRRVRRGFYVPLNAGIHALDFTILVVDFAVEKAPRISIRQNPLRPPRFDKAQSALSLPSKRFKRDRTSQGSLLLSSKSFHRTAESTLRIGNTKYNGGVVPIVECCLVVVAVGIGSNTAAAAAAAAGVSRNKRREGRRKGRYKELDRTEKIEAETFRGQAS